MGGCNSLRKLGSPFPVPSCIPLLMGLMVSIRTEYHNCFPFGGLEETTRSPSSNYVDEDYPARPEIKQSLTGWSDNCGSESSTLETDVCVWRYASIACHIRRRRIRTEDKSKTHITKTCSVLQADVTIWQTLYPIPSYIPPFPLSTPFLRLASPSHLFYRRPSPPLPCHKLALLNPARASEFLKERHKLSHLGRGSDPSCKSNYDIFGGQVLVARISISFVPSYVTFVCLFEQHTCWDSGKDQLRSPPLNPPVRSHRLDQCQRCDSYCDCCHKVLDYSARQHSVQVSTGADWLQHVLWWRT